MGLLSLLLGGGNQNDPMQGSSGYGQSLFGNPSVGSSGGSLSFNQPSGGGILQTILGRNTVLPQNGQPPGYGLLDRLGDAFLVQAGHPAMHRQNYEEDLQQQALGPDFTQDPNAAAGRLAQAPGGMAGGLDLYKTAQTLAAQRQNIQSEMAARQATMDAAIQKQYGSMVGTITDAGRYQAMLPLLRAKSAQLGFPAPPDTYDPNWVKQNADVGMDVYRQGRLPLMERQVAAQEQNANTNEAYRAGQTSQGQARVGQGQEKIDQTSPNEVLGGIMQKIAGGQRINQRERLIYNDYIRNKTAGSQNARTNQQKADTGTAAVNMKNGLPPFKADAKKYPNGVNDGQGNHFVVVGGQWVAQPVE